MKPPPNHSFTLLELLAVIALLTLVFSAVFFNLENLSPKYKLQALAQQIANTIENAQNLATLHGKTFGIRYDLPQKRYGLLYPADFNQDPRFPTTQPYVLEYNQLPPNIQKWEIQLPHTTLQTGRHDIKIDPWGQKGSHILVLYNQQGQTAYLKFLSTSGIVQISEKKLTFHAYHENP